MCTPDEDLAHGVMNEQADDNTNFQQISETSEGVMDEQANDTTPPAACRSVGGRHGTPTPSPADSDAKQAGIKATLSWRDGPTRGSTHSAERWLWK